MDDPTTPELPSARPRPRALDFSHANAALFTALVEAQRTVETVGKRGRNTSVRGGYNYATSDDMLHAARVALSKVGIAFLSSWRLVDAEQPAGDIGEQFVVCSVVIQFALVHQDGGRIEGESEIDAIGGRGRPTDKAVAAALTYGLGFTVRGLLSLDRDDVRDEEQVDARPDRESDAPVRRPRPVERIEPAGTVRRESPRQRMTAAWREFVEVSRALGREPAWSDMAPTLLEHTEVWPKDPSPEQYDEAARALTRRSALAWEELHSAKKV